jgi:small subunit ribosomal protein S13
MFARLESADTNHTSGGCRLAEEKDGKTKGAGKGKKKDAKEEAKPAKTPQAEKKDENFRYIVRLVNSDLDGNKNIVIALSGIKGVGLRTAEIIAKMANVPRSTKIGDLPEEKTEELEKLVLDYSEQAPHWMVNRQHDWSSGADMHIVGVDVELYKRDDVNLMRMIRCYKGVRHETGQKVRGQRTRANGRSGLTLGVMKRKEQPGGGAAKKE